MTKQNRNNMKKTTTTVTTVKVPVRSGPNQKKKKGPSGTRVQVNLAPVAKSFRRKTMGMPVQKNGYENGRPICYVEHEECLGSIAAGATADALNITTFRLNPGLLGTFPWLSAIAVNWEWYVFEFLEFEIEPVVGTQNDGMWYAAIDYDSFDANPSTVTQLTSMYGAQRSSIWDGLKLKADPTSLKIVPRRYTRSQSQPTGSDIRLYDSGNLFIASQTTMVAPKKLGDLFVRYRVKLGTPQPAPQIQSAPATNNYKFVGPMPAPGNLFKAAANLYSGVGNANNAASFPSTAEKLKFGLPAESILTVVSDINSTTNMYDGVEMTYPADPNFLVKFLGSSWWTSEGLASGREWLQLAVKSTGNLGSLSEIAFKLLGNGGVGVSSAPIVATVVNSTLANFNNLESTYLPNILLEVTEEEDLEQKVKILTVRRKRDGPSSKRGVERTVTPLTPSDQRHLGSSSAYDFRAY